MGFLRPATPLSIIFLVAFVLLLLSTLSTPIIHAIPLGAYEGYSFGVFGYCKGDVCSGFKIGYSTDDLFSGDSSFTLPSTTRHSLSAILIVHPVAAFLALVCFGLAIAAHFHGPSHSPRYLLALLILTIPTLLVTLLAFLVDILLFVPHMQWGGWIVLAATILIIVSTVVTCAMRRTLVSRKARKKRIAENADMSGANYYDNMASTQQPRMMQDELPRADSPPPLDSVSAREDGVGIGKGGVAQYAAFEMRNTQSGDSNVEGTTGNAMSPNDDRQPLNPARDPSIRSTSTGGGQRMWYAQDAPPMPAGGRPSMDSNGMSPRRPSRDQYGNPIPIAAAAAGVGIAASDLPPPGLRHQGSQGSLGSRGSGGYGPQRGRGGYAPNQRGAYGPGPGARGGYGPRGGMRGGYRGQGPPPPGWRGRGGYGPPPRGIMRGGMNGPGGPRGPPPPVYMAASDQAVRPVQNDPYYGSRGTPPPPQSYERQVLLDDEFVAGPIGPIGQAIEMDERTGSSPVYQQQQQQQQPEMSPAEMQPQQSVSPYGLRDSDGDVAGMVGLQQGGGYGEPAHSGGLMRHESEASHGSGSALRSPTSVYSGESAYVPPRAQWQQQQQRQAPPHQQQPQLQMPGAFMVNESTSSQNVAPLSPIQASPTSPPRGGLAPQHRGGGSENYHEDVDPRFAVDPNFAVNPPSEAGSHISALPNALTPGGGYGSSPTTYGQQQQQMRMPPQTQDPFHLQAPSSRSNIPSYVSASVDGSGEGGTDRDHSTPSLLGHHAPHPLAGPDDHSDEHLPTGARSPAAGSDTSHFTSVSQRPVNPNWRPPPPGGPGPGPGPGYGARGPGAPSTTASAAQRRVEDVVLTANPDFALPGMTPMGRGRVGYRGRGGMGRGNPAAMGLTPGGRYPTDL